jgi:hypothetical protein
MNKVKVKVTEDLQSYSSSARASRRDYHLRCVPSTVWRWVQDQSEENFALKESTYCEILCVDEFYPSGKAVVSVVDDRSGKVLTQDQWEKVTKKEILENMVRKRVKKLKGDTFHVKEFVSQSSYFSKKEMKSSELR